MKFIKYWIREINSPITECNFQQCDIVLLKQKKLVNFETDWIGKIANVKKNHVVVLTNREKYMKKFKRNIQKVRPLNHELVV